MADINSTSTVTAVTNIGKTVASELKLNELLINSVLAILILIAGILIGKLVSYILAKIFKQLEVKKHIRGSFLDLIAAVVRWAIYLIFLHFALEQLGMPVVSNLFGNVLITIPAFIASLVILTLGFAIALYLRNVIEDAEIKGWDLISKAFFYFVLYVFGAYVLRIALIPLGPELANWIIVALTLAIPITFAILISKRKLPAE